MHVLVGTPFLPTYAYDLQDLVYVRVITKIPEKCILMSLATLNLTICRQFCLVESLIIKKINQEGKSSCSYLCSGVFEISNYHSFHIGKLKLAT